jgi:hypothetical protein
VIDTFDGIACTLKRITYTLAGMVDTFEEIVNIFNGIAYTLKRNTGVFGGIAGVLGGRGDCVLRKGVGEGERGLLGHDKADADAIVGVGGRVGGA